MTTTAAHLWMAVQGDPTAARAGVETLTTEVPEAPRVGDPDAAGNLREAVLLARAAVGAISPSTMMFLDGGRLGHHVREDGSIVPVLAERLVAGGEPDPGWPDQLVRDAVTEPERYAALLLGSPFRVVARRPERVMELATASTVGATPVGATRGSLAVDADLSWRRVRAGVLADLPCPGRWTPGPDLLNLAAAAELAPERETDLLPLLDAKDRAAAVRHAIELETTCLRHAARVAAPHLEGPPTADKLALVWRLGQQLRRVLMESPFLGADAELLNARLLPLLPSHPAGAPPSERATAGRAEPTDAWWPERFASVDLGEVLALTALARRGRRVELSARVAAAVQVVAARACTEAELAREVAVADGRDALRVGTPHGAPPVLARWLLHRSGAPWLGALPEAAREETFALLRAGWDRPARVRWILWGIERELRGGADPRAVAALRDWLPGAIAGASGEDRVPALVVAAALVGAGPLAPSPAEAAAWLAGAAEAPEWEVGVLRTFAERAPPLRAAALDALRGCALREPTRVAAAKALLSLARGGVVDLDGLRAWWAEAPSVVRGDPTLARDFQELDQRDPRRAG